MSLNHFIALNKPKASPTQGEKFMALARTKAPPS